MSDQNAGQVIGDYQLQELLGEGGMGSVYRAIDIQLQRPVALKLMHPEIGRQEKFRQRFIQEARAIGMLDHPNIVKVFSFHADQGLLYLIMEYVATGSLRGYLNRMYRDSKFVTLLEAVALIRQIASALDYAHQQGMVHRDIKPDNVLLKVSTSSGIGDTNFNALLTDFGLVKMAENAILQTQGNHPMGTLPYMSPEQIKGDEVDGRTDLYALGVMMYELIVGKLPFMPSNILEAAEMHIKTPPPQPSSVRPGIVPELEAIIMKALAKDVNDRYKTGRDLIFALQRLDLSDNGKVTILDTQARASDKLDSLGTYLASMPGMPQGVNVAIPQLGNLVSDELVIVKEGAAPERYKISKQSLTLGREDQDITLPSSRVSRLHARIDKQSNNNYTITDLGSTNGTFLDGAKLLANVPEKLVPGQVISLGEYRLSLQKAGGKKDTMPMGAPSISDPRAGPSGTILDVRAAPPSNPGAPPQKVTIQLNPQALRVEPGMRTDAQIEIFNQSELVEHFRVNVQGLPIEWVIMPQSTLQLMPGTRGTLPITIHPPRNPTATAGTYNLGLRVSSEERGMEIARGTGTLSVNSFHNFAVDMSPKRVRKNGKVRISVSNTGNTPDSYTISGRDREEGLTFIPPSTSLSVGPGRVETVEMEVRPRKTSLLGTPTIYPLEMRAVSSTSDFHVENGELAATPLLPYWILGVATLLCTLCVGLALFAYSQQTARSNDHKTETAQVIAAAQNQSTALAQTQSAETTSTFVAGQNAATQTAISVTGTAQMEQNFATQTNIANQNSATQTAIFGSLTAAAVQTQNSAAQTQNAQAGTAIVQTQQAVLTANALAMQSSNMTATAQMMSAQATGTAQAMANAMTMTADSMASGAADQESALNSPFRIVLYNTGFGNGEIGALSDSNNYYPLQTFGEAANWTHLSTAKNATVLFYNQTSGDAEVGTVSREGNMTISTQPLWDTGWTLTSTANNLTLNYQFSGGAWWVGYVDGTDWTTVDYSDPYFSPDWTHIEGSPAGWIFYSNISGGVAVGNVTTDDPATCAASCFVTYSSSISWPTGFSHMLAPVIEGNQLVFLYDTNTGYYQTYQLIVDQGSQTASADLWQESYIDAGWTSMVAVGDRLFFYNTFTGAAQVGRLLSNGVYQAETNLSNLTPGWTHITVSVWQ
ncbi:MAG: protein kinase [Chloroflexi bacterium]|nr:protein kinase [Chloroflexota bacterium]